MEPKTKPPPQIKAPAPSFELANLKLANLVYFCSNAANSADRIASTPQAREIPRMSRRVRTV
jgi:hypothetical protein